MTMAEVEARFRQIVATQFEVSADTITPETNFREDLDADSLALIELVMEMEEAFNVEVPQKDIRKITTFGEALAYINSYAANAAADQVQTVSSEAVQNMA